MKLGIILAGAVLLLAAPRAHALVNLELDSNDLFTTQPSTGTAMYYFTGEVDLTDGWTIGVNGNNTVYSPYDTSGDFLKTVFDPSYLAWSSGSESTNYSGVILDVSVKSSSPGGLYFLSSDLFDVAQVSVTAYDPTDTYSFTSAEDYEVHVATTAPEPASMVALGGLALFGIRRRKRSR